MTISVTQLNNYIRGLIDMDGVLGDLTVAGEVTNVKRYGSGYYFSLKDDGGAINCFCYNADKALEQGNMVIAEGSLNYFVKNGSISFFVKRLTATKNTGDAYLRFLELKEKLQKEGLFDDARKQIVPSFCQKVGIVTSQTGAVIVDITNVALRRQPFCNLYLYPVKVQGDCADVEIAQGINYFANTDVDAIIVGRGGGSNEDLSVFNSEIIVRAIANCPKPVVSAVGHGVDYTLCDFVADKRAVTPSEAAEFVTTDVSAVKRHVKTIIGKLNSKIQRQLEFDSQFVVNFQKRILSQLTYRIESEKLSLKHTLQNISTKVQNAFLRRQMQFDSVSSRLSAVNPMSILKRGYAFVESNGAPVKSVAELQVGQQLTVHVVDGKVIATVNDKEQK